jgi:hypothetical protein
MRLTHKRWAMEQHQELKDELGLDHFEGRTLPVWQRHVVLTALTYSWLQSERHRRGTPPADPSAGARGDHRDPDCSFLRDPAALLEDHSETGRN